MSGEIDPGPGPGRSHDVLTASGPNGASGMPLEFKTAHDGNAPRFIRTCRSNTDARQCV